MMVPSLQNSSRRVIVWMLRLLLRHKNPSEYASSVYKYLLYATPLLPEIAQASQYHKDATLTDIFLPIILEKGKLHVTNYNIYCVKNYWREKKSVNLSTVTHLKVGDIEGSHCFNFLPFLGHLSNLQFLDIGCFIDDELLAVVGMNCPHLEVFDAREGMVNTVTNTGLSYLCQCKKLRRVLFSTFADEYSCMQDRLGFRGSGIALLLLSLPNIEQVLCSEYLLRDALNFLYQTSYNKRTIPVKCMFLDHPEVGVCNTLMQIMPLWCPNVEVLTLYVICGKERTIGNSLRLLTKLKILVINVSSGCHYSHFNFSSFGPQLVYLQITAHMIGSHDIKLISASCPNLKTLGLKMYSFGFDGLINDKTLEPIFPSVEKLELQQNISVRLFKYLNTHMENLQKVYCAWATVHDLQEALKVIVQSGGWQKTTLLVLPVMSQLSLPVAKMITDVLPKLACLGITLLPSQEEELIRHVRNHLLNVNLVDQEDVASPSNSGIFSQNMWTEELKKR